MKMGTKFAYLHDSIPDASSRINFFTLCPKLTPVAGLIFEIKNPQIFLERFFAVGAI